jgi:hypothetical protein
MPINNTIQMVGPETILAAPLIRRYNLRNRLSSTPTRSQLLTRLETRRCHQQDVFVP